MTPTVVLATGNVKKLVELRRLVEAAGADLTVLGLGDLPPYPEPAETERTFEGNALLKARACVAATGLPALADDSGLAVDVLNGMPGVRSARWSGPDATDASNNALLLAQLDDVPDEERTAHFAAAVALVLPDGRERTTTGRMDGRLLRAPVGENGFGYDPLFVADGQTVSNGVLDAAQKDRISHRGQAVRAMVALLLDGLLEELTKETHG
jgi:XTP/dITP diphosphohydrolase